MHGGPGNSFLPGPLSVSGDEERGAVRTRNRRRELAEIFHPELRMCPLPFYKGGFFTAKKSLTQRRRETERRKERRGGPLYPPEGDFAGSVLGVLCASVVHFNKGAEGDSFPWHAGEGGKRSRQGAEGLVRASPPPGDLGGLYLL